MRCFGFFQVIGIVSLLKKKIASSRREKQPRQGKKRKKTRSLSLSFLSFLSLSLPLLPPRGSLDVDVFDRADCNGRRGSSSN